MRNVAMTILAIGVAACLRAPAQPKPLKALMIAGGCCHDYPKQKKIVSEGISARANVVWTIVHEGKDRKHKVSVYDKKNWAEGYDVVVHNECFGGVTDTKFVENIIRPHRDGGLPALVLHCSAHTYRNAKNADEWRKFLGITSTNHGPKYRITVNNLKAAHPVMKGFPKTWITPQGELYNIKKVWDTTTPLAHGYLKDKKKTNVCIWVNTFGKGRTFGTTIGHHNETMQTDVYLDLITRGLLWACDKLDEEGKPKPGYGPPKKK